MGWGGDGVAARGPDVVAVDGVGGAEAQRDGLIGEDADDARATAALLVLALEGIAVKATNQRTQNPPTRERYTSSSLVPGIRRARHADRAWRALRSSLRVSARS